MTKETNPKLQIHHAAEALEPQPPMEYVVKNLLTKGSVTLIYGEPGSKKTYALGSLGVCVAIGKTWLEFETVPTKVLFLDEESGRVRFTRRLGEIMRGEEAGPQTPFTYICLGGFKLDKANDNVLLQTIIEEYAVGLIIIDALADVMDGDENAKQDTQPIFTNMKRLAEQTGTAVIIIHHANKQGGYRGSSAIKGAVDNMILVESKNGTNVVTFKSEKVRDGKDQTWAAIATWHEDRFTLRPYHLQEYAHYSKAEMYVLNYLEKHGASAIPVIMANADVCSEQAARQAVYSLTGKRKISRTNPGASGKGATAIYTITEGIDEK